MLKIPKTVLDGVISSVEASYPEEGCGLLVGFIDRGVRVVTTSIATRNTYSKSRRNRYAIDPLEYMRVEEAAIKDGRQVIGVFHSHPDSPAVPSRYDTEYALPLFTYLIISVWRGRAEQVMAWQLDEVRGEFFQERIEVT
ncbi:MAG: M67 family metallopeptidase [Aigarchaeota archaeon]|nr:M67 family metallopeptidase [Aigarchaeota archaeon]MDW8092542.1 M67 family metallopeptidase [Nitrososphaerota archaeon]